MLFQIYDQKFNLECIIYNLLLKNWVELILSSKCSVKDNTFNSIVQIIPHKYPMFIYLNLIKPKSKDSYKNLQFYVILC